MRYAFWSLLIAVLCAGAPAAPARAPLAWRHSLDVALKEAAEPGLPVFVLVSPDGGAQTAVRSLELDDAFAAAAPLAVLVRVVPGDAALARLPGEAEGAFVAAVISPGGKALASYSSMPAGEVLAADIRSARADWLIDSAAKAAAVKNDASAVKSLLGALELAPPHARLQAARAALDKITERGRVKVREAGELAAAAKYSEARAAWGKLAAEYAGTDAGREAAARIEELARNPRVAEAIAREAGEAEAQKYLGLAKDAEDKGRLTEAAGLYEKITRDYAKTSLASEAHAGLMRTQGRAADQSKAARKKMENDCRSWLAAADALAGVGKNDKAVDYYQKVIDAYPATGFADIARERMKKLRNLPSQ